MYLKKLCVGVCVGARGWGGVDAKVRLRMRKRNWTLLLYWGSKF